MINERLIKTKMEKYLRLPLNMAIVQFLMNIIVYFIDIKAGIAVTCFFVLYLVIAVAFYIKSKPMIQNEMIDFAIEHGQVQKQLLTDFAVPYILTDSEGKILWSNNQYKEVMGKEITSKRNIMQAFPDITIENLPQGVEKNRFSLRVEEKVYNIELRRVKLESPEDQAAYNTELNTLVAIYFFDETNLNRYIRQNKEEKLVAGLIYIDNFDEALESIEDVRRSLLVALVDRKIKKYMQNIDAVCKNLEKDKYFIVMKQKHMLDLQANKFSLLEEIRTINIGNDMSMTLSISMAMNCDSYVEAFEMATATMDLALGRGGDQAVVRDGEKIYYYGGKSQIVEKNTRVKARIKAHALKETIETKEKIIIMGHSLPDVDSIGAAIGIYRLAKTLNKRAHIVINEATISIRPIINNFIGNSMYEEDLFINSEEAIEIVDNDTLLVVVDVNRPSYTECPDLLTLAKHIVVLDHHRQTSETIDDSILSYIEPYASSTCEMVAEILQYVSDKPKLKPIEADAMYSGILVDTDNFVTKTGVRTFEAAAFLRRSGADVVRVRKMSREDMDNYKIRANIIQNAEVFETEFALSVFESGNIDSPTVLAAQAANELLDIDGISASFVLTTVKGKIYISARSIDDINVQLVMEKFGGGGHLNVAGAQLENSTMEEAVVNLKDVLRNMLEEGDI